MADSFEQAKSFLLKADASGKSLYDHLTNLLVQLFKEKPENSLAAFESLSARLKEEALMVPHRQELPSFHQELKPHAQLSAALEKSTALCRGTTPAEDDELPEEEDVSEHVPDLLMQNELFKWAGIDFGETVIYSLALSIQSLARAKSLTDVRFFGKVLGTKRDYFVVEAKMSEYPDEDEEKGGEESRKEPFGTGANEFVYFASNSPLGPWTMLPAVTPEMFIVARQARRFFSGDLNEAVLGFPRFPWGEAALLRTQVGRIASATVLAPRNFFQVDNDGDEPTIIASEEFEPLKPEDLLSMENWVHERSHLLKQGRTSPYQESHDEDDDHEPTEEEQEEPAPRLSSIDQDVVDAMTNCWTIRNGADGAVSPPHTSVFAKSLIWPGAVAICKGHTFANVYIGWGQKYLPHPYSPPAPPVIQSEYVADFKADEGETDPLAEQVDPLPPKDLEGDEGGEGDIEDEGSEGDEEDDDE